MQQSTPHSQQPLEGFSIAQHCISSRIAQPPLALRAHCHQDLLPAAKIQFTYINVIPWNSAYSQSFQNDGAYI